MRRLLYAIIIAIIFIGCRTAGTTPNGFSDAMLVAEQRLELERQSAYIAELERSLQRGVEDLRAAREHFNSLESTNLEFRAWLQRVDEFVREIIRIQSELERVQRSNSGANAGTGRGSLLGLSGYRKIGEEESYETYMDYWIGIISCHSCSTNCTHTEVQINQITEVDLKLR